MFRWLPVLVLLAAIVALAPLSDEARAAEVDASCNALFAQTANDGGFINDFGLFGVLDFHLDGPLDQPRSFMLTGFAPINVGGTAQPDGTLNGIGFGKYDGTNTFVDFSGNVSFYDDFSFIPRLISGTYVIGPNGELPGGLTTEITTYCTFNPPQEIADPDNDGIDSTIIVPGNLNLEGTGVLAPGQTELRLRTQAGGVQDISLADPSQFTVEFQKFGPVDAIIERSYNRTRAEFVGAFSPSSFVNIDLPPELDDSVEQSLLAGGYLSNIKMDAANTTILREYSWSIGHGSPFPLLGGAESSGPWTWNTMTRNNVSQFDFLTGDFFYVDVATNFASDNLFVTPDGTGAEWEGLGDPLTFIESFQGQFAPAFAPVVDNCPDVANPDQADADLDGNGDACDGVPWHDANCSGRQNTRDGLRTLFFVAGIPVEPAINCPQFGEQLPTQTFGDWNCDGTVDLADVTFQLLSFAKENGPPVPDGCPAPGELVPE